MNYMVTDTELTAIADAIRNKNGTTASLAYPAGYITAINDLNSSSTTIDRIYIDTPPNRIYYTTGDHFDPTGMIVKIDIIDTSGSYTEIINGYTYYTGELTTEQDNITISFTGFGSTVSVNQAIVVNDIDVIFNNNTWTAISRIAQAGIGQNYWDIGDCKAIQLNGNIHSSITLLNYTTYVFILDFNHPINKTISDNNIILGGFKTALTDGKDICLIDSQYNDIGAFNMNHYGTTSSSPYYSNYGGWKGCDFRYDVLGAVSKSPSYYNRTKTTSNIGYDATIAAITSPKTNTLMATLPNDFRNVLRLWTRWVDNKGNSSNVDTNVTSCIDAGISLLTEYEVHGTRSFANQYEQNHQKQITYYVNSNSKIKYKYNDIATSVNWWVASPFYNDASRFCFVATNGSKDYRHSYMSTGLAPAFKV